MSEHAGTEDANAIPSSRLKLVSWVLAGIGLALIVWGILLIQASQMNVATGYRTGGRPEIGFGIILLLVATSVLLRSTGRLKPSEVAAEAQPIGFTETGQPVFPIVGYTPDGKPVTANQVPGGVRVATAHTNTLAIVALVCGFVLAPLAIPIGHIALVQIRRTGEHGRVLAIVGLTLGYISTVLIVITVLLVSAGA